MASKILFSLLLVIFPKVTKPQSVSTLMGARSAALGNASSTLVDGWSQYNNVGSIAKVETSRADFAYSLSPYLPGANRAAVSIHLPFTYGTLASGIFKFGDELYSEQVISVAYGNQFGIASLGARLSYIQYKAEGFQTRAAWGVSFGGLAELSPQFSIGAHIVNLNEPKISVDDSESIPAQLTTGIQFHPNEKLLLLMEIEKSVNNKSTVKGGIEYELYKKVRFRTGFNLNPQVISGGLGYQSHRLVIDYAIQYNPEILSTFQISSGYRLGQTKPSQ